MFFRRITLALIFRHFQPLITRFCQKHFIKRTEYLPEQISYIRIILYYQNFNISNRPLFYPSPARKVAL